MISKSCQTGTATCRGTPGPGCCWHQHFGGIESRDTAVQPAMQNPATHSSKAAYCACGEWQKTQKLPSYAQQEQICSSSNTQHLPVSRWARSGGQQCSWRCISGLALITTRGGNARACTYSLPTCRNSLGPEQHTGIAPSQPTTLAHC